MKDISFFIDACKTFFYSASGEVHKSFEINYGVRIPERIARNARTIECGNLRGDVHPSVSFVQWSGKKEHCDPCPVFDGVREFILYGAKQGDHVRIALEDGKVFEVPVHINGYHLDQDAIHSVKSGVIIPNSLTREPSIFVASPGIDYEIILQKENNGVFKEELMNIEDPSKRIHKMPTSFSDHMGIAISFNTEPNVHCEHKHIVQGCFGDDPGIYVYSNGKMYHGCEAFYRSLTAYVGTIEELSSLLDGFSCQEVDIRIPERLERDAEMLLRRNGFLMSRARINQKPISIL